MRRRTINAARVSDPGEIHIQFPAGWKWEDAKRWLEGHNLSATLRPSEMPYRWGAWRPIKGAHCPVDVYVATNDNK